MKIIVQNNILDTDLFWRIGEVHEIQNSGYYKFTIYIFNNKEFDVNLGWTDDVVTGVKFTIKASAEISKRRGREAYSIIAKEKLNGLRNDIIKTWSGSISSLPVFNLK